MLRNEPDSPRKSNHTRFWTGLLVALVLGGCALYAFAWVPTSRPGGDPEAVSEARSGMGLLGFFVAVAGLIITTWTFLLWIRNRDASTILSNSVALIALAALANAVPLSIWVARFISAADRIGR